MLIRYIVFENSVDLCYVVSNMSGCARKEETMKIAYLGDVMCLRDEKFRCREVHYLEGLHFMLQQSDFVVANLETPLTRDEYRGSLISGKNRFVSPVRMAVQIKRAGVTHVSVANNHCLDQGFDGLMETLDCLEMVGLPAIGARRYAAAPTYAVLEKYGIRVGIISSTYGTNTIENRNWMTPAQALHLNMSQNQELSHPFMRKLYFRRWRWYMRWMRLVNPEAEAWFDRREFSCAKRRALAKEIARLKQEEHPDLIVAFPHSGGQHRAEPMKSVRLLYRWFFRRGVAAVIGHHEHLIQRTEWVRGRLAAYCLGNAVCPPDMGLNAPEKHENCSVLLHQYVNRRGDGSIHLRYAFSIVQTYVAPDGCICTRPFHELIAESREEEERGRLIALLNLLGSRFLGRSWCAESPTDSEHPIVMPA